MSQTTHNTSILQKYIPEKAVNTIVDWIIKYDFKLRIKKSRSSKYGDYRPPFKGQNHLITINYDLNPYSFLITLVHEIAHLTNWNKHTNTVLPHGSEWKLEFKILMNYFLYEQIFPLDVTVALKKYMENPAASSCSDTNLLRILKKYDTHQNSTLLEELPTGTIFQYNNDRLFIKGEQVRKRFKCKELKGNRTYLFNPLTEVTILQLPEKKEETPKLFNIFN